MLKIFHCEKCLIKWNWSNFLFEDCWEPDLILLCQIDDINFIISFDNHLHYLYIRRIMCTDSKEECNQLEKGFSKFKNRILIRYILFCFWTRFYKNRKKKKNRKKMKKKTNNLLATKKKVHWTQESGKDAIRMDFEKKTKLWYHRKQNKTKREKTKVEISLQTKKLLQLICSVKIIYVSHFPHICLASRINSAKKFDKIRLAREKWTN